MSVLAKRHRYLEAISRRPLEKPSIIETLDAPRSTVNRAIRELEQTDLVKRTDEGYQLTLVGRTVLNEYREYDANIEMICGAAEVMAEIPDAVPFDVQILQNADVIVAEPPAVDEPLNYLLGLFERADRIEMVTSVVLRSYFDVWHRRLPRTRRGASLAGRRGHDDRVRPRVRGSARNRPYGGQRTHDGPSVRTRRRGRDVRRSNVTRRVFGHGRLRAHLDDGSCSGSVGQRFVCGAPGRFDEADSRSSAPGSQQLTTTACETGGPEEAVVALGIPAQFAGPNDPLNATPLAVPGDGVAAVFTDSRLPRNRSHCTMV